MGGALVEFTANETELLRVLSLDAGRVATFETLRRVWAKRQNAAANLVCIFVRNLRRKLGDSAASPAYSVQRARRRLPHGETVCRIGHAAGTAHPPPAARPPPAATAASIRRASV